MGWRSWATSQHSSQLNTRGFRRKKKCAKLGILGAQNWNITFQNTMFHTFHEKLLLNSSTYESSIGVYTLDRYSCQNFSIVRTNFIAFQEKREGAILGYLTNISILK